MASELTLNSKLVGTRCQWPFWRKVQAIPPTPQPALWEDVAHIDNRSPNFYYEVTFSIFLLSTTPVTIKIELSQLRDFIGEGPFGGQFLHPDATINFVGLHWIASPDPTEDGIRADKFDIKFWTLTEPEDVTP